MIYSMSVKVEKAYVLGVVENYITAKRKNGHIVDNQELSVSSTVCGLFLLFMEY